ncbi:hypothetical protein GCM10009769_33890 [Curtobacterium luteum]|uniref:Uncharacterized protein n=1 Tax=Curtobacterium luteum TaxID=33881 RepID=A0A8H9GDH7_9MICO|nr:hypothetical protein GCM10009769_33890 [Curtobacterium luteum]
MLVAYVRDALVRTRRQDGDSTVISEPVTGGQPLDLQATDGATSMWVVDGIGNRHRILRTRRRCARPVDLHR